MATVTRTVSFDLSVEDLAAAFANMDDDTQARFFVEVARIMEAWPGVARLMQPHYIGRHLTDCECSTEAARELVRGIHDGMTAAPTLTKAEARG